MYRYTTYVWEYKSMHKLDAPTGQEGLTDPRCQRSIYIFSATNSALLYLISFRKRRVALFLR